MLRLTKIQSDGEIATVTCSKKPKRIYSRPHRNWLINEFNAPSLLPSNIIHLMEEDLDRMIKHVPRPMNKTKKSRSNDRRRDKRRNELQDHIDDQLFRERVIELLNMIEIHAEVQREVQPEVDIKILSKPRSLFFESLVIGYTMNGDVVWIDVSDADDCEADVDDCDAGAGADECDTGADECDAGADASDWELPKNCTFFLDL